MVPSITASIKSYSELVGVSKKKILEVAAITFEESVIKAAISSEVLPFMSIALVTVTVPVVAAPMVLRLVALILVPSASVMVIVPE